MGGVFDVAIFVMFNEIRLNDVMVSLLNISGREFGNAQLHGEILR